MWKGRSAAEVRRTFRRIHGVGPALANMAVLLIERAYGVMLDDLDRPSIDIKPDIHTMPVLHRLGVSDAPTPDAVDRHQAGHPHHACAPPTRRIGREDSRRRRPGSTRTAPTLPWRARRTTLADRQELVHGQRAPLRRVPRDPALRLLSAGVARPTPAPTPRASWPSHPGMPGSGGRGGRGPACAQGGWRAGVLRGGGACLRPRRRRT